LKMRQEKYEKKVEEKMEIAFNSIKPFIAMLINDIWLETVKEEMDESSPIRVRACVFLSHLSFSLRNVMERKLSADIKENFMQTLMIPKLPKEQSPIDNAPKSSIMSGPRAKAKSFRKSLSMRKSLSNIKGAIETFAKTMWGQLIGAHQRDAIMNQRPISGRVQDQDIHFEGENAAKMIRKVFEPFCIHGERSLLERPDEELSIKHKFYRLTIVLEKFGEICAGETNQFYKRYIGDKELTFRDEPTFHPSDFEIFQNTMDQNFGALTAIATAHNNAVKEHYEGWRVPKILECRRASDFEKYFQALHDVNRETNPFSIAENALIEISRSGSLREHYRLDGQKLWNDEIDIFCQVLEGSNPSACKYVKTDEDYVELMKSFCFDVKLDESSKEG